MKIVSRLLLLAGASLTSFVIACAYGTPYRYTRTGKVVDRATQQGIGGIQVSCVRADGTAESVTTTVADGSFLLDYNTTCAQLEADDVDGTANGRYRSASVAFDPAAESTVVTLEKE